MLARSKILTFINMYLKLNHISGSPAHMAVAELLQTCKDNERRTIVLRSDGILLTRHHRAVTDL